MNKGTAIEKSKKTKMIFATLKALTTMTPFIREKRLIFASKNPLTTPQEAKDATATLALWFFRGRFLDHVSASKLSGGIRAISLAANGPLPHPPFCNKH